MSFEKVVMSLGEDHSDSTVEGRLGKSRSRWVMTEASSV